MIRTLQSRISLAYIAVSLVLTLLLAILSSVAFERYFLNRLANDLQADTGILHAYLKEGITQPTSRAITTQTLSGIAAARGMRITLVTTDGVVLYDSSIPDEQLNTLDNHGTRPEILEADRYGIGSNFRFSTTRNAEMMYIARRVDEEFSVSPLFPQLRFIRVGLPATDVYETTRQIRMTVILAAVLVFLLVLVISRTIARRIASPIEEITTAVREIKEGNLDRRISIRSDDEIGRLAAHMNEMAETLKADIDQLKRLERVRSEFLGNVSHELRTPIFSLKGFLETLLEGALDDRNVNRTFVERAYHHANRLDALLADLIEISRIESGEMKMSFRYFPVDEFLQRVAEEFEGIASRHNQHLVIENNAGGISVFGDKERLRQAMANIVDNALKYSGNGATITLRAESVDGKVRITIRDTGPGIAEVHLPRIFERFYRVDRDRSREVGGTGLGLAIVKHIIEAHGSRVCVLSELGKGTAFWFDLKQ